MICAFVFSFIITVALILSIYLGPPQVSTVFIPPPLLPLSPDQSRGLRLIVICAFVFSFIITVALILSIYLGPPQVGPKNKILYMLVATFVICLWPLITVWIQSGPTECPAWCGSKPFDILMVFLKLIFERINLNILQTINSFLVSGDFCYIRPPDKRAYQKIIFLISQPKHMLWVLKRTISIRRFIWAPKTFV